MWKSFKLNWAYKGFVRSMQVKGKKNQNVFFLSAKNKWIKGDISGVSQLLYKSPKAAKESN